MKKSLTLACIVSMVAIVVTCAPPERAPLTEGKWRGEFEVKGRRIPFNFAVDGPHTNLQVTLLNAAERAKLDSVSYRGDSVVIAIDLYDAILIGRVTGDSLHGFFRKNQVPSRGIPFRAARNQDFRFVASATVEPLVVSGKWSVNMISENDGKRSQRYTVGVLEQTGKKVSGTILTTTGDYRYLEGVVDGDVVKLSAFSGSGPSLIEARLSDSLHFSGEYISQGGNVLIEAVKSDTAKLPDAYKLTYLKDGFDRLKFSFPDLSGKMISLKDEKYQNKVVVLTILGSWCPNCVDEAEFLAPWYKKNKDRGVEVVGISFERKDDLEFARKRLQPLIRRFDIGYDILFGGIADKKIVAEKLPELNTFLSFPTTFFIDRTGKVRKVHTGYNGPATGHYYEEFVAGFEAEVIALLNEPSVIAAKNDSSSD